MRTGASYRLILAIGVLAVASGCRITTVPGATPIRNPVVAPPTPTFAAALPTIGLATIAPQTPGLVATPMPPDDPGQPAGLLAHVPAAIAGLCNPNTVPDPAAVESLYCPQPGGVVTWYWLYPDQASTDSSFDYYWNSLASDAVNGGLCEGNASGVGTVTHPLGGAGRYLCYFEDVVDAYYLYWTSESSSILSLSASSSLDGLFDWWEIAGPIAGPVANVPPDEPPPPVDPPIDPPPIDPPPIDPPPIDPPPVAPPNQIGVCGGPAPDPLTVADLLGSWAYVHGVTYEEGGDSNATVGGSVILGGDLRWTGDRVISLGGNPPIDSTAYGPGTFSFDGYVLTMNYDDGSFADTFNKVRIGEGVTENGNYQRSMTLQVSYEDGGCIIYTLLFEG